ncbi:helix-turn-helix transcriptional regulator [Flavisphingomonas formosensis]|uniref:helix-turn-helix transcriptional regulator n=1 Tax=Flavisphingomonas formosensis TaxID=861534 RepID=UPI0012F7096E|nr:helix-turn-helix transcriptional regulator [Sphingomonas formosensis]
MEGEFWTAAELQLANFRLEVLSQHSSGPFQRTHEIDEPSLIYMPPPFTSPARGCLGEGGTYSPFGTAIVVPARTPLHVISPGFPNREFIIARFDEDRFRELTRIGPESSGEELAACVDIRAPAVLDLLERLSIELPRPSIARDTVIAGLGLMLLGELARYFATVRGGEGLHVGNLAPWQMRRIDERLADRTRPPPDVGELAELCGVGRRHLMRAFKATTGRTVMDHVERSLFTRAAWMLAETAMPLKAIAAELGYDHQGSFATAFRRRFGETPSHYRTRRMNGVPVLQ